MSARPTTLDWNGLTFSLEWEDLWEDVARVRAEAILPNGSKLYMANVGRTASEAITKLINQADTHWWE